MNGSTTLLRLLERTRDENKLFRWDEIFLKPASRMGETATLAIKATIDERTGIQTTLLEEGDTLVLDNWRMLHSRARVPAGCETRLIERVYLESLH